MKSRMRSTGGPSGVSRSWAGTWWAKWRSPGRIDLVQPLEEALALELGEGFTDGLADIVAIAEELDVGVVDELEDVVGLAAGW